MWSSRSYCKGGSPQCGAVGDTAGGGSPQHGSSRSYCWWGSPQGEALGYTAGGGSPQCGAVVRQHVYGTVGHTVGTRGEDGGVPNSLDNHEGGRVEKA